MTKSKIINVNNCSPQLWKKMNDNQRENFNVFYSLFMEELAILSSRFNEIKAHNLAYRAATNITPIDYEGE